jgi:cytochrome c oxidase accessory protein FixG
LSFAVLVALWLGLPWLRVGGHPAVFFDIDHSNLFLFGAVYNSQDAWLLSFGLAAIGFGVVYVTALAGRVWCGWACPQTVFLEGVYRRIERLVEGSRDRRLRRRQAGWTGERLVRRAVAHSLYAAVSFAIAIIVLTYFVTAQQAVVMVRHGFVSNPRALAWVSIVAIVLYFNFSWFREQLCVVICPYGRLQSVLLDEDSLVVGFDARRGEPRGKKGEAGAGACVDCRRCVVVCPTGIDVRNGVQLECIACTACIDACDDVMRRLGRTKGLVRYDSQAGLAGRVRRFLRPRLIIYSGLLVVGAFVATVVASRRMDFEATLLRLPGPPYAVEEGVVRNAVQIHLVNKRSVPERFVVEVEPRPDMTALVPLREVAVAPLGDARAPILLSVPGSRFQGDFQVRAHVTSEMNRARSVVVTAMFLGPSR